jgi:hypothetical protein
VQWLQDHAGFVNPTKEELRSVTYFTVPPPPGLPYHFDASFRQRGTDDYTYKVRGPAPWPSTGWTIPACAMLKVDNEYDVAIGADGKVDDVKASHSCDGTSLAAFGDVFANARPQSRPCRITMERSHLEWGVGAVDEGKSPKELKVEQWSFTSLKGTENLVEISWKGKASQADNERFSALVQSLPKGFPNALPLGKEKRAEACDANK